jgi:hypothetical protein
VRQWAGLCDLPDGRGPAEPPSPTGSFVDYSFSGVNLDTVAFAPKESMQFGRALQRVMSSIVLSDPRSYDAVYLSKIDIANGVYRVWLQTWDISKLGMVLPTAPGEEPLMAFPLALPMGRVESPPYFTAITETARDLANSNLRRTPRLPVQRLEAVASTPLPDSGCVTPRNRAASQVGATVRHEGRPPLATVEVFVDDFLLLAQTESQKERVLRETLHAVDSVPAPSLVVGSTRTPGTVIREENDEGGCLLVNHESHLGLGF